MKHCPRTIFVAAVSLLLALALLSPLLARTTEPAAARPSPVAATDLVRRAVVAVVRSESWTWAVRGSPEVTWGRPGDVAVPADYDGDGRTDVAVWRPSTGVWWVRGRPPLTWGRAGDVPVPADYDGDGRADVAVWRPSSGVWLVRGRPRVAWGASGDVAVPADFNGDRHADVAVWRRSTGVWWIRGRPQVSWGRSGDVPVPADYDGNGTTDVAVWRPSTGRWLLRGLPDVTWGRRGDRLVPADYDGNGTTDIAVWRPSTGAWLVRGLPDTTWGRAGDRPVQLAVPSTPTAPFHAVVTAAPAQRMHASWRRGCPVAIRDLRLLSVSHVGFDHRVHRGELVVHRKQAGPLSRVFRRLYDARFPIRRMRLVDEYGADDDRSMSDDNTSAFNCRAVTGRPGVWSQHSYGWAVDVNPFENPYVSGSTVLPAEAAAYADRSRRDPGMVHAGDFVVRAFGSIGWTWGGSWSGPKDYQHFSVTGR
jgi:hypothetical protein